MRFLSTLVASTIGTLVALGIVAFIGMLFLAALAASTGQAPPVRSGSLLEIELSGPILEQVSDDPFMRLATDAPAYSLQDVKLALRKAAADDRINGAWLQLREVDASWATLQELRKALLEFKASGKPLLASSDEYTMDEVEYFLASAADSVFAAPEAFFEFNGFYINVAFFSGLLENLDIDPQIVRAGRFKSAVEPFTRDDLSAENREQLAVLLETQDEVFAEAIAESRGRTADAIRQLMEEDALLTAEDAVDAGLLDGLLFEDEVIDVVKARLGLEDEDDLNTVSLDAYVNVPASAAGLEVEHEGEIAIVYAVGSILSGESGQGVVGSETFGKAMREARESDRVRAVVLRINSPGGSAAASNAMWREVALTSETKPVIVSMGDVAASGGYWIATAADTIVANPLTITGSIGVFGVLFDVGDFFENKVGITFDNVRTSPYADMFSAVRPLSEPERRLLERAITSTYRTFLEKVAASQGLDVARVDSIGQGRVWTGVQAHELGLVDVLGDLDTAVRIAAEAAGVEGETYRLRTLPRPPTFIEQLSDALRGEARDVWVRLSTGPSERALVQHAQALRRLVELHGTTQARMPLDISIR